MTYIVLREWKEFTGWNNIAVTSNLPLAQAWEKLDKNNRRYVIFGDIDEKHIEEEVAKYSNERNINESNLY